MEVEYWSGGLLRHEVDAIERMRKSFLSSESKNAIHNKVSANNSMADQLKAAGFASNVQPSGMWPWKGYAGFRFIDSRSKEGEYDLVIVTHKNILIVELKHWFGNITSHGGNWYQNGDERGTSPVTVTQKKAHILQNKLNLIRSKLPDGRVPVIKFCVVLTGQCTFDELPDIEREHVISINEFLKIANEREYNNRFKPHPNAAGLNQYFQVFDEVLNQGSLPPKELVVDGFRAKEKIFEHPGKIYIEYQAINENNKSQRALLRKWDFKNLDDVDSKTQEGRYKILSRERDVLVYLEERSLDLSRRCLRPMRNPSAHSITQEYSELSELPSGHYRLNEFINRHVEQLSEPERIGLSKILVSQFSVMHRFKVAHRDLGDHSIWISPSSSIALSNFIAAYYQPAGTVGPHRGQLSIGSIEMPEDRSDFHHRGTPFHRDVFALGILCWHLINAKPIPLKLDRAYIDGLKNSVRESNLWYSPIFCKALEDNPELRFNDASEFLDKLNQVAPKTSEKYDFDPATIERFGYATFNPYKEFPEDEQILESNKDKDVYRSGDYIVKIWSSIHADSPRPGQGHLLLSFFEKIEALQQSNYEFLPRIERFGYGRGGSPFLVQSYVDSPHWDEIQCSSINVALSIIRKLIAAVECLHEQNIGHGDIHPRNIKVRLPTTSEESSCVFLLDIPDLSSEASQPFNAKYSPTYESCTTFERDNFAVMRMAMELLGMSWDVHANSDIPKLRSCIEHEISSDSGFISLERFRDALDKAFLQTADNSSITISVSGRDIPNFCIYPDNGRLFLKIEKDSSNPNVAMITFNGLGGSFTAIYDISAKAFSKAYRPKIQDFVYYKIAESADYELNLKINVVVSHVSDLKTLTAFINTQEEFHSLACEIINSAPYPKTSDSITEIDDRQLLGAALDESDNAVPQDFDKKLRPNSISVSSIWKAILDTESESHPVVEVADESRISKDKNGLLIPYYSKKQVLDDFDDEDRIMLSKKKDEKTFDLGEIDLSKSTKSELYLSLNKKSKGINIGDLLYLQTKLSKSSFSRRKRAMERLLDRLSVVPNLMDYFDENCDKAPQDFSPPPTEEDFSVYERELPNGQMIGLNDAQKKAFSRLISRGPLGLLQGPPGTGKTEFIAAFCHYLIAQQGVKNILLVSQSHEAVNTAAERIRSHCRRLQTDLDVVRFSNREQAVSEELKDVYSKSIVTRQQNSFRAEIKQRFSLMAPSLGVSSLFIECLIDIQRSVGSLVKGINRIRADFSPDDEKHNAQLERSLQTMRTELFSELRSNYDIASNAESNVDDLLNQVYTLVAGQHGVRTHELNRCLSLISLTNELIDRISSDRANYDEFLTRSRTLVCGTCVGIGLGHLKLAENRFDWVIIDEAARSSPTELAIAMQVGHRVLLVGDHRQLPPTYEEEHQKAIARTLGIHHRSPDLQLIMRSDFERAFDSPYGKLVNATLKTQYRMQPAIGQLVSEVFYSGDLETGSRPIPQYFNSPPEIIKPVVTWLDTGALGKKAHHPEKKGNSLINPAEADCIINLLKIIEGDIDFSGCLIEESSKSQEPAIGIICMYSDQKKHIRKKFAENSWSEDFKRIVKIDTVDSYQGKENRVVIVSLTRSDVEHSPGFLVSPNRINVAMSRAMDRLIIVGDMRVWGGRNASLPLGRVATYIRDRQHEDSYSITSAHNLKGAM